MDGIDRAGTTNAQDHTNYKTQAAAAGARTKEHGDDGSAGKARQEDQHQMVQPRVERVGPHAHGGAQAEGDEADLIDVCGGWGVK